MKRRVAAATAGLSLITGVGVAAAWRRIMRDFDRVADGPDTWDDAHRHLERFWEQVDPS